MHILTDTRQVYSFEEVCTKLGVDYDKVRQIQATDSEVVVSFITEEYGASNWSQRTRP